jgi:ribonuclease-3
VYLQHGIDTARKVILHLFGNLLDTAPTLGAGLDWKTSLQELCASKGLGPPSYVVTSTGPDHDKQFTASVVVGEAQYGTGVGRSKKEAEQKAAAHTWQAIMDQQPDA